MHRLVAGAGDAEADHALLVAEFLDGPLGLLRRVERQIDQRFDPVVAGQDPVDQPAVIGVAEPHLHFRLRMHAEKQHRRREHHHVVDAERIHRPARQGDVAMDVGFLDDFALAVLMRDASADRLIAQSEIAVEPVRRRADPLGLKSHRVVANHGILDIGDDLLPGHGLDVMGVDVADEPVLQTAPDAHCAGHARGCRGCRCERSICCTAEYCGPILP